MERENGEDVIKILRLLSFFNPDGILISFLQSGSKGLREDLRTLLEDELYLSELFNQLHLLSLIKLNQNQIRIHSLLGNIIREQLTEHELRQYQDEVMALCDTAFPNFFTNVDRENARETLEQIIEPVMDAAGAGFQSEQISTLLTRIGLFLTQEWKYGQSGRLEQIKMAVTHDFRATSSSHPMTIGTLENCGTSYWNQGRLREAAHLYRKALESKETRPREAQDCPTQFSLANMASVYHCLGKTKEAKDMESEMLKLATGTMLPQAEENPSRLTCLNNLAVSYSLHGRVQTAADLHEKVLGMRSKQLNEEHFDILVSQSNLASAYWKQGKLQAAERWHETVLKTRTRILGEHHPRTLLSLGNAACANWSQGNSKLAAEREETLLRARKRTVGETHPQTLLAMNNLAFTYKDLGRTKESLALMRNVVDVSERFLGHEHADTLQYRKTLTEWEGIAPLKS